MLTGISWRISTGDFQLPLSGSQDREKVKAAVTQMLAFNSLSRDHIGYLIGLLFLAFRVPFNSLSRDHSPSALEALRLPGVAFNSLSRDHQLP